MFTKKPKIKDERIEAQNNKIFAETARLILTLLFVSILIKAYILDMNFKMYISESIIFFVGSVYMTVRSAMSGSIDFGGFKGKEGRSNLAGIAIYAIIGGMIFGTAVAVNNYFKYKFDPSMIPSIIITLFIEFAVMVFAIIWILGVVSDKKNKELESKLDDEE